VLGNSPDPSGREDFVECPANSGMGNWPRHVNGAPFPLKEQALDRGLDRRTRAEPTVVNALRCSWTNVFMPVTEPRRSERPQGVLYEVLAVLVAVKREKLAFTMAGWISLRYTLEGVGQV